GKERARVRGADVEGQEGRRVVVAEHRYVRVHAERGVHVLQGVAAVGDREAGELRLVEVLELRPNGRDLALNRRVEARIRRRVARRHVVEREDEVDDVFVADGEVPRHRAL